MNTTNVTKTIGMDMTSPYGVYVNAELVAEYETEQEAAAHYRKLRLDLISPEQRQREKDKNRTALQCPISSNKMCILYLKNQIEHQSPWFYSDDRAQKALEILKAKYGKRNAIIYLD